jgi:hypothetical protein
MPFAWKNVRKGSQLKKIIENYYSMVYLFYAGPQTLRFCIVFSPRPTAYIS